MNSKIANILLLTILAILATSCGTIIGGNQPTDRSSGSGTGPATIGSGDQSLQNDKFSALTINGDLNANRITIVNDLNIESNASLKNVTVRDDTSIKGSLEAISCTFKDSVTIGTNITSTDSYFGNGINFGGNKLQLTARSKIIGNIISSANTPVMVIIDKSTVKGNISFTKAGGQVILQNGGKLKGQVTNGQLINK